MSDAMLAMGRELQGLGGAVQQMGVTVYKVDARNKFEKESQAIATDIEAFKQSLWKDPTAGTPGLRDGYMAKWDEFKKGIDERIEKLDNPLARQQIQEYWADASLSQESAVAEVQFKRWASNTIADTARRIQDRIETGALGAQEQLDLAAEDIRFLYENNLVSKGEYDSMMAQTSQQILLKDLRAKAEAIYEKKGLAAAQIFIAKEATVYAAGADTFVAGDQVKELARQAIGQYHEAIQLQEHGRIQGIFSLFYEAKEGKKVAPGEFLTAEKIKASRLDPDRKQYWLHQLDSYLLGAGGSDREKRIAAEAENGLELMAFALAAGKGEIAGQAKILVGTDDAGNPAWWPVTMEGYEALSATYHGALMSQSGYGRRDATRRTDMANADLGIYKDAFSYLEDKLPPDQFARASTYLRAWGRTNPSATPEKILDLAKREITAKLYTTKLMGRFEYAKRGDADDTLVFDLWDNRMTDHVLQLAGDGTRLPVHWATKDALESYMSGMQKEVGAVTKLFDPTQRLPGNVTAYWQAKDAYGNADAVVRVTKDDGSVEEYTGVPLVDSAGKRIKATLIRTTTSGPTGAKKMTREIYDPDTETWVAVADTERKPTGWTLPKGVTAAKDARSADIAAKERAITAAQEELSEMAKTLQARGYEDITGHPDYKAIEQRIEQMKKALEQARTGPAAPAPGAPGAVRAMDK